MIEFTFTDKAGSSWTIEIRLSKDMTGGQAFDEAAAQYKAVFSSWVPGDPNVTIAMRGK